MRSESTASTPGLIRRLGTRATRLVWMVFPREVREDLRTELSLEYRLHVRPTRGAWASWRWYARQFLGSLAWHLTSGKKFLLRPRPGISSMDSLLADLRFAMRSFRRTRALTALAVLTIALGVGASTAVFSVLDTVVLRPLPYPDPGRLVHMWHDGVITKAVMTRLLQSSRSFDPLAGSIVARRTLIGPTEPEELSGLEVNSGYWPLFGARPALGTLPLAASTDPGQEPLVVVSHRLWQRTFGGDPSLVGRTIRLGGDDITVTGVMAETFVPLSKSVDFWMPMRIDPSNFSDYEGSGQVSLYGRLADGVTLAAAREELQALAEREHVAAPEGYSEEWVQRSAPLPLHDVLVGNSSTALWTTMGAVLLLLLIACANVANLLLARAGARQREIALRIGLGAPRGRIVRQLLTESVVLAMVGGALGAILATAVTAQLGAAWARVLPRVDTVRVDATVLGFCLLATLTAALLFGLVPALRASSNVPRSHLTEGGTAGTSASNRRLSRLLVAAEVALSVVLVIGAALMLRTLGEIVSVHPGFESAAVTTFRIRIPTTTAGGESIPSPTFFRLVRENLERLPGVEAVGGTTLLPMASGISTTLYEIPGREAADGQALPNAAFQLAAGDYLRAMSIPLLRGRDFSSADVDGAPIVALVNETMARAAFGAADPIGRRLTMFGDTELEVIGVVGDTRQRSPDLAPEPEVIFRFDQVSFWPGMHIVLRTADPAPSAETIRAAVWNVDPTVPILDLQAMEEVVAEASGRTRLFARALAAFGILALILAAVGVFGVTAHALRQQVSEFGIRLALGATPGSILRRALLGSLGAVMLGAAVGLIAAGALSRLLQSSLYGVSALDPLTFVAVPLLLALVGVLAAYVPARRAARLDPVRTLRAE